jgi:hypothetical protein
MTFAGFCAIVIVLRQTTGKELSSFHLVFDPALSGIWQIAHRVLWSPPARRRSEIC